MELTKSKPQKTIHGFMHRANVDSLSEEMRNILVNVKSGKSKNISLKKTFLKMPENIVTQILR